MIRKISFTVTIDIVPTPQLTFTQDDFYEGDEYAYPEDEDKLPWNFEQIYNSMRNIRQIFYNVDHFKPDKGEVGSWVNSYKVAWIYSENGSILSMREYSYSANNYIDMTENGFPLNEQTEQLKEFYPESKPDLFRVAGEEEYKTNEGVFTCTIVEAIGIFDEKVKSWMINNKPGVFAKIIIVRDEGSSFDYTDVYSLKDIEY